MPASLINRVNEGTTSQITFSLTSETGAAVVAASLLTMTLTLWNDVDHTIINSRNAQDVLNTNGVTIDSAGLVTWIGSIADNVMVDRTLETELHIAEFNWTYPNPQGTKDGKHQVGVRVVRVGRPS